MMPILYDIFFFFFSLAYLPYLALKSKAHKDFGQRFGRLPTSFNEVGSSRPIWIHAVSVGEVLAAKNFIEALSKKFAGKRIVLSTTTKTGNDIANKNLGKEILKFYFPLDISFIVKRVVGCINPCAFVVMETEIWPNLITELSRRKIPILLINGRISKKSFVGYRKIKFIFAGILRKINRLCMQTEADAERIEKLGAPKGHIRVTGNMKFDVDDGGKTAMPSKKDLGLEESCELMIAGSTHAGEEEIILDVYDGLTKKFGNLRLLVAPRHIDRREVIKRLAEKRGLKCIFLSEFSKTTGPIQEDTVLILDTLGRLSALFSIATVVFMGGSLVKRGGHNLVEPAVFGKPIVFGPHMFNFQNMARLFLDNGAAVKVRDREALEKVLEGLLKDRKERERLGHRAKELIQGSRGATERNVEELARIIEI